MGERTLNEAAWRAVEEYNRYRAPESMAEVLEVGDGYVKVRFRGTFTETCGVNDWIEDFIYVMEALGLEAELVEIREPDDPLELGSERIATFRVKAPNSP